MSLAKVLWVLPRCRAAATGVPPGVLAEVPRGCGRGSVGFFGDDLSAEGLHQQIGVRPRVLLQQHVILTDRISFFLRRQRLLRRHLSRLGPPSLLSRNRSLRRPPLTSRLLPPIHPTLSRRLTRPLTWSRSLLTPRLPRIHIRRHVVLRLRRLLHNHRRPTRSRPQTTPPTTRAGRAARTTRTVRATRTTRTAHATRTSQSIRGTRTSRSRATRATRPGAGRTC